MISHAVDFLRGGAVRMLAMVSLLATEIRLISAAYASSKGSDSDTLRVNEVASGAV
jgi:hypothetical protein